MRAIRIYTWRFYTTYLLVTNISFSDTCLPITSGTNIFYNNYLYMRSIIIYNILNT